MQPKVLDHDAQTTILERSRRETLRDDLVGMLSHEPQQLRTRLARMFDGTVGDVKDRLVLCGAGWLGRRTLVGLRSLGIEPLAFLDNNRTLWNTDVDGLCILRPNEAVAAYHDSAVFVVTIFNPSPVRQQLVSLGCQRVVTFPSLAWKYAQTFLPFGGLGNIERIYDDRRRVTEAAGLWDDERSRDYYFSQLRWRLDMDSSRLPRPCPAADTYFPDDLVIPRDDEVFVDCGAFDGDSIRAFIARRNGAFREAVALEPDPLNFSALTRYIDHLDIDTRRRIVPRPLAAASHNGQLSFELHGDMSSSATTGRGATLRCARLDELPLDHPPTYLKMDIEGAELDALEGARGIMTDHQPVLAICAYHQQDHLWRIPLLINSICRSYRLFLRVYAEDCWELVCYAVPESRLRA